MMRPTLRESLRICLALLLMTTASHAVRADFQSSSGSGSLSVSAKLNFSVVVANYVSLRVGNADATVSQVNFNVAITPAVTAGDSKPWTGSVPPALAITTSTTNPTSTAGVLSVAAFTNVKGTLLSCNIGTLAGTTAFGATVTAGGIPGRNDVLVASSGTLAHPGTNLAACNGSTTSSIPMLSNLAGTFTYSTSVTPGALLSDSYGAIVTYTATTL